MTCYVHGSQADCRQTVFCRRDKVMSRCLGVRPKIQRKRMPRRPWSRAHQASNFAPHPEKAWEERNNRSTFQPKTARYLCLECLPTLLPLLAISKRDHPDCLLRKEENKHSRGTKTLNRNGLLLGPVEARRWTASKDFANALSFYRGRNLRRCHCLASAYFDCGVLLLPILTVYIAGQ